MELPQQRRTQQDWRFLDEIIASTGAGAEVSSSLKGGAGAGKGPGQGQTLDIRAYTQQIKQQLYKLEDECTFDFMSLNQEALKLYKDINKSEQILGKVQSVVDGFQGELEHISDEVRNLQHKSESFNLSHKKTLNKLLSNYLDNTLLTEEMVDYLFSANIDDDLDQYIEKVDKLNDMVFYVQHPPQAIGQNSVSLQQIKPEIEKLKHRVCQRAYKFLVMKMNNLRKPNTNFQIYQESILLKYRALAYFLKLHNLEAFQELCEKYCEIMNDLYSSKLHMYFKDIRNNVSTSNFQLDASRKQQKSQIRKELTTRLIRILMLHFTTYIEIVSVGHFGEQNQFLRSMVSNTTQRNQVLLDLKNFQMSA